VAIPAKFLKYECHLWTSRHLW